MIDKIKSALNGYFKWILTVILIPIAAWAGTEIINQGKELTAVSKDVKSVERRCDYQDRTVADNKSSIEKLSVLARELLSIAKTNQEIARTNQRLLEKHMDREER